MRIGLLTDVYRSGFSGVANHVILLKKCLSDLGHQVAVFAFENPGRHPTEPDVFFSPGITITANYPFGFRLSRPAKDAIQAMDILHVHQPFASGYVALQQHKRNGVPLVFTSHTRYDLLSQAYLPWIPSDLSLPVMKQVIRNFSSHLKFMIAPAPEMEMMLKSWKVRAPIQVIPNGVDLSDFRDGANKKVNLRAQFGLSEDTFIFLYAGRIAPEKNIPFLIDSFSMISNTGGRIALVLAGGGPKVQEIQRYITSKGLEKQVFMTGRVDYADMPAIMHAADVFVTTSKSEVHPLTVIEAGASGLPAIGLHAPGVSSIVQDQVTGFLCQEDREIFARQMLFLANHRDISRQLGENAARSAEEYSYTITARRVLSIYQSIIEPVNHPANASSPVSG